MKSDAGRVKEDYLNRLKKMRKVARHWKQLAKALGAIVGAYRLGRSSPGRALDRAEAAIGKLRELGEIES